MAIRKFTDTNIGTRPEDTPQTLNTTIGAEGSPTDRLWKCYRTELTERDMCMRTTSEAPEESSRIDVMHGLRNLLRWLVARPA